MPKVLHVVYGYFPDPVGGTEIFVRQLARSLDPCGWQSVIAAPAPATSESVVDGLSVHRFAVCSGSDPLKDAYGQEDPQTRKLFSALLDRVGPNVVHVHAATGITAGLMEETRSRGIPVVFMYHTPTVSCAQGGLRLNGTSVCDGRLEVRRCAACMLKSRHVPSWISELLSRLPPSVGQQVSRGVPASRGVTVLRMSELMDHRQLYFHRLMNAADRVVAPCRWVEELLLLNHVPPAKMRRCAQGLDASVHELSAPISRSTELRVLYLGRLDSVKGIQTVIGAIRSIPQAPLLFDIYGIDQGHDTETLRSLAGKDRRIQFRAPVDHSEVQSTLRAHDLLVVPSLGLETGPLTVLEAFEAGVPVLGSNLGGIAELVTPEVSGWLLPPGDVKAWARALSDVAFNPSRLDSVKRGIPRPRCIDQVAQDIVSLYEEVVSERLSHRSQGAAR